MPSSDQHLLHAREERADVAVGGVAPQRRARGRERRVVEESSEALTDADEGLWALQVLALQPVARLLSKGLLDELSGCAEPGQGDVRAAREHQWKVRIPASSKTVRGIRLDAEMVLRGAVA